MILGIQKIKLKQGFPICWGNRRNFPHFNISIFIRKKKYLPSTLAVLNEGGID